MFGREMSTYFVGVIISTAKILAKSQCHPRSEDETGFEIFVVMRGPWVLAVA